jgi:CspA family cold shock protein
MRMGQMGAGTIVRFDRGRGYGFVSPDAGGEDVFFHASLLDHSDVDQVRSGKRVEFRAVTSERGPKAVSMQLLVARNDVPTVAALVAARQSRPATDAVRRLEDDLCDVLSTAEFGQEVVNVLIELMPTASAADVGLVRQRLTVLAQQHGWVDR